MMKDRHNCKTRMTSSTHIARINHERIPNHTVSNGSTNPFFLFFFLFFFYTAQFVSFLNFLKLLSLFLSFLLRIKKLIIFFSCSCAHAPKQTVLDFSRRLTYLRTALNQYKDQGATLAMLRQKNVISQGKKKRQLLQIESVSNHLS